MKFRVWKSEVNGQWYWSLVARNGKIIAQSEGYIKKAGALKGIASVRANVNAPIVEGEFNAD